MVLKGYHFTDVGKRSFGLSKMGLHTSKFRVVVVEFDTSFDLEYGDLNGNHVGIDVDSLLSVKFCNISSQNIFLNSVKKLVSWIDYDASAKRLEVRLCYSGSNTLSSCTNRMGVNDSVPSLDSSGSRSKYNANVVQSESNHCTNYNVDYSNVYTVEDDAIDCGTHCRASSVPSNKQETHQLPL
ncbi:hypothetical protein LWI28_027161 [Acer negundo]|uniref:Legume lectin domain-containing protein n=1 Tax=Acer negundo TaxID=4023 RepID=A0AAD5ISY2_ACENE|nr:hypothetical protein LWI28_027161 [Acer negundo]